MGAFIGNAVERLSPSLPPFVLRAIVSMKSIPVKVGNLHHNIFALQRSNFFSFQERALSTSVGGRVHGTRHTRAAPPRIGRKSPAGLQMRRCFPELRLPAPTSAFSLRTDPTAAKSWVLPPSHPRRCRLGKAASSSRQLFECSPHLRRWRRDHVSQRCGSQSRPSPAPWLA